jgi:NADH:ubiquinone oxidoreductase subunit H
MKSFLLNYVKEFLENLSITCYHIRHGWATMGELYVLFGNWISLPVIMFIYNWTLEPLFPYFQYLLKSLISFISNNFVLSVNFWNFFFTIVFSLKFIFLISILVFVRGGIPRYRYDYLTKIGWLRLLSLTVAFFLTSLFLCFILL